MYCSSVVNSYPANVENIGEHLIVFQYISIKMQRYTAYLYLETALHVSGGISTHNQERIQLYLQYLVFVTPLLLPAVIVEIGLIVLCVAYATHSTLKPVPTDSGR
jgi:hypothetical protein